MTAAVAQTSVALQQGFGVPGELYTDAPFYIQPFTLVSALASYNVIGATACTITSQGVAQAGSGGTFGYAGILVNPKQQQLLGDGSNPLNPSSTVPNNTQVACVTMGTIVATITTTANIGDLVVFDNTTGALSTIAPGANLPTGKSFAYAFVDRYTVSVAGLAVLTLNPQLTVPVPA